MSEIILLFVGAVLGTLGALIVQHWGRIAGRLGLDILIEIDPAVFLAGGPNWDGFTYIVPDTTVDGVGDPPQEVCREWFQWARSRGAVTASEQRIQVILVPRGGATVLIEALVPEVVAARPGLKGTQVVCSTGGANGSLRHIEIDLRDTLTPYVNLWDDMGEGVSKKPFKFTIGSGDAERFEIHARVGADSCVEWRATIHLISNGRRYSRSIDDNGQPFHISGTARTTGYVWSQSRWKQLIV